MQLVLSLFPGADLFGRAFERIGFSVVRGPDKLWGGDVRDFHVPPGKFDGIIGGPPCQTFSNLTKMNGTNAVNLIPEFVRIVEEAQPKWAVMENVPGAKLHAPNWPAVFTRDWDMGGLTNRPRAFWFYGVPAAPKPVRAPGKPAWSVMASSWKGRTGKNGKGGTQGMWQELTPEEAARLQGFPGLHEYMAQSLPDGMSEAAKRVLIIHMLGNGVPMASGLYIAWHIKSSTEGVEAHNGTAQMSLPIVA
jgi:DNA (cytosine-5)-methyltransferase 1